MSAVVTGAAAGVVPGWLPALPVSATVAGVAQPSPGPSPESFTTLNVSPGLAGFVPVFLIALACIVLFLSLTRHLRRVTVRQAQVDAADREAAAQREQEAQREQGPRHGEGPRDGQGPRDGFGPQDGLDGLDGRPGTAGPADGADRP